MQENTFSQSADLFPVVETTATQDEAPPEAVSEPIPDLSPPIIEVDSETVPEALSPDFPPEPSLQEYFQNAASDFLFALDAVQQDSYKTVSRADVDRVLWAVLDILRRPKVQEPKLEQQTEDPTGGSPSS